MSIWLQISLVFNLLGAGQGLFLSFLFFSKKTGNRLSNRLLGFLILAFVFPIVNTLRVLVGLDISFKLFEFYSNISLLTLGPLIYLYILVITQKDFVWGKQCWWHFAPYFLFLLYVLLYSGFYFFQASIITQIDVWGSFLEPLVFLLLNLQMAYYFFHSYRQINQYHHHYRPELKLRLSWLKYILGGYIFTWCVNLSVIALINFYPIPDYVYLNVTLLLAFHVFFIAYKAWQQPEISEVLQQKYQGSKLDKGKRLQILALLQQSLQKDKAYLNSNLTVKTLAQSLGMQSRHISQVINQELEQNFQDFINQYRVEEVKQRLASPIYNHLTILAIANEAGFKSSSTFNQAFKKHTGLLPSAYRKTVKRG